jgi:demethylmenaquinone methyltransferase/2-methoxy-6-polyprenyl-1,4-benzoquinol methylase
VTDTHFGFRTVSEAEKAGHVRQVFDSVAERYDLMNDLMSVGLHRIWKAWTIAQAHLREGHEVLDVASGTGDLAMAMAPRVGLTGRVIMTDINAEMLVRGRDRLLNAGHRVAAMVCDAEALPFADDQFDRVTLAFGLRNMTHKEQALAQILRVLKPGGKLLVLEFSRVIKPLERVYDFYSFKILPWLGERITQDRHSYEYLAESIRMHPGPIELAEMMRGIGFGVVRHSSHTGGVVALHQAVKV